MKEISNINLSQKKYIIFDMDGTLIDSIGIWNITDYRLINSLSGLEIDLDTIQKEREKFLESNQGSDIYLEYCRYLIQKYNLKTTPEELLKLRWDVSSKFLEEDVDFKPQVADLIKLLKELGCTLVLATATTQVQLDIYENKNKNMLKQMNIADYFDLIIRKEDVKNKKPHPEIYLSVLQHFNAKPEECLVFEDSLHGVIASTSAGIETINIYDSYSDSDREEIEKITDYKIGTYQEFIDLLNIRGIAVRTRKIEEK